MNASRMLSVGLGLVSLATTALSAQEPKRARAVARDLPRLAPAPPVGGAPTVARVAPVGIPLTNRPPIYIIGRGFVSGATVTIGGVSATSVFVNDTLLQAAPPVAAAGARDVVVTTGGGSATCTGCLTYDAELGAGETIDEMWERGGEGPIGIWREERLQRGTATTVLMEAHCPANWLPIGAGIANSASTPFYMATSYPTDDKWRILMQRRMVPPVGGQLLFPPERYAFFMTVTCLDRDAFNRVMRPPPSD
jgi:hypothetical protein